jgi:DNA-binding NarL/FixJ family response regulator
MDAQLMKNAADYLRLPGDSEPSAERAARFKKLTPREEDVLEQLARGFRYKEIVANLGISKGTLNGHICRVYEKLQVHSRTEAVVKYLCHCPQFK